MKLSIKTGSEPFSGTNARLYLIFCTRGSGRIYEVPTRAGDLETGKLDVYEAAIPDGPDLAELTAVLLLNGMNGPSPAWRVLWVRLVAVDTDGQSWSLPTPCSNAGSRPAPAKLPPPLSPCTSRSGGWKSRTALGAPPPPSSLCLSKAHRRPCLCPSTNTNSAKATAPFAAAPSPSAGL
ncbi:MAG: hypothetical protein M5U12_15620 [Verrucomicrobia bacterium]|nr:hypothetical protein [Verrucomicrobiota bacterium]